MNFSATRAATAIGAETVTVAGERALCDPRGTLFFPDLSLLAVSDLHLEKGSSFARRGALIPPYDTVATLARLEAVIADYQPGSSSASATPSMTARAPSACIPISASGSKLMAGRDWFWVAGNHDPEAPADLPGETVLELAVGSVLFRHEPSKQRIEGEIAGHLHPCARIVQRGRSVRRRCFAGDGGRLIMPAFGAYTGSLNVLDRAYSGLFRRETLMAYMLGAERVFAISGAMLRPG
ncbi:ligase-associated DNA damage response endonuclease PdeM [Mesorhizobium amorphae]|uniref:ligase-associated DNA damage response endonuclease PdeM n=1 Tax=Mesorhizobium amorphae TaxID=71433 RepID=UPI001186B80C|nr:ligase-associated DNA damage response endonuclease PdeM [Mesorhizobium amorphae]